MPTDVVMPQMGESIFEGTITKWLKKPGEKVQRDEPLFEISTDKVDAEIPSPTAGVLKEIKVPEGTTVQVNTVVGVIAGEGEAAGAPASQATAAEPARTAGKPAPGAAPAEGPAPSPPTTLAPPTAQPAAPSGRKGDGARGVSEPAAPSEGEEETEVPTYLRDRAEVEPAAKSKEREAETKQAETVIQFPSEFDRTEEGERIRSSPLVRRLAREHGINLSEVQGTGLGGRITRDDIMKFIEQRKAAPAAPRPAAPAAGPAAAAPPRVTGAPPTPPPAAYQPAAQAAPYQAGAAAPAMPAREPMAIPGEVVPMSQMRKIIAQRMVESKRISAHVHSVFEVDLTRIVNLRNRLKDDFERRTGSKLSFTPFFCRAAINAIRQWPIVNASVEGDNIHYHRNVHLGIAVSLDWGLIVPVVKNAEELNFLGLQRAITDLANRARSKKLKPDEVQGGTFSITNPGSYGQMFGLPIIPQPQVAILGIGSIKKQPVVTTSEDGVDSIAIRSICHISLGYDHRVVDGAVADQFLRDVAQYLQNWNEDLG